ncbi:VOC family protein [Chitinophaga alhagiae]|uniref:VOC family protein n=1 Tax=Chitinophaga alhagiae TaxID=2203219 RepID=UPI000E5A3FE4|nr:VOC family protein [Chitinophaga alhagiae]
MNNNKPTAGIKSMCIGLPVTDLDKAVAWYRQLFPGVMELNPAPDVWEFEVIPGGWLQLFPHNGTSAKPVMVRFESGNIAASHHLATTIGSNVEEITLVPGVIRYFDFSDPFGNPLSFYEMVEEKEM